MEKKGAGPFAKMAILQPMVSKVVRSLAFGFAGDYFCN